MLILFEIVLQAIVYPYFALSNAPRGPFAVVMPPLWPASTITAPHAQQRGRRNIAESVGTRTQKLLASSSPNCQAGIFLLASDSREADLFVLLISSDLAAVSGIRSRRFRSIEAKPAREGCDDSSSFILRQAQGPTGHRRNNTLPLANRCSSLL